ncbi:hypothetical protein [Actinoplanes palleronii]|uniref:hypothetical protein n=1 Tax=Actinoplanes palleronii TaxID=113570 RepID=UPI00194251F0|nr:hypothetical protein [Actinoplanes palleronii]
MKPIKGVTATRLNGRYETRCEDVDRSRPTCGELDAGLITAFEQHPIHAVLATCAEMRPTVSISVQ